MNPYYADASVTVYGGDCLDVLRELPDNSVDAVVTDPPYGLEFMGKEWDRFRVDDPGTNRHRGERAGEQGTTGGAERWTGPDGRSMPSRRVGYGAGKRPTTNVCEGCGKRDQFRNPHTCPDGTAWRSEILNPHAAPPTSLAFQQWCELWATECLRVLKPGGHMLAFGGTRTFHRLTCAVEDAGFEIRDSIAWLYGSGFPKSLDVSKAIDKAAGAERTEVAGKGWHASTRGGEGVTIGRFAEEYQPGDAAKGRDLLAPATDAARQWQGWGTALKPAFEPVVVARKPLAGTVAANVTAWGVGALNVDGCRIGYASDADQASAQALADLRAKGRRLGVLGEPGQGDSLAAAVSGDTRTGHEEARQNTAGRWPANVILDEHYEPVLRLKYNLPTEVERTIRESFGASTSHLPAVLSDDRGPAEPEAPPEVLRRQVPRSVDVGEPRRREGAAVRQAAHTGDAGEDRGHESSQPADGRELPELEGRPIPERGIRLRQVEWTAGARAGDVQADGDSERLQVHPGAPVGGGSQSGSGADLGRGGASHQRREGRQPAGESGAPRVEQLAPDEARRGGRRDVPASTGERTAPVAPLDVLQRECPPGWWQHFDVVGRRRESQAAALDQMSGETVSSARPRHNTAEAHNRTVSMGGTNADWTTGGHEDSGGASRFFYTAKADAGERVRVDGVAHPTVKPLSLMRWLVRLVTPPGGTVLEPFAGSGTTVEACVLEGFHCIAVEREADYLPLIVQRVNRQRDPIAYTATAGEDLGLFGFEELA